MATDTSKNIQLAGEWKYAIAAEYRNAVFYLMDILKGDWMQRPKVTAVGATTISGLYNAMLYPIAPYTIKGALWYQGETNVGRAIQYQTLLPAMVKSWRELWNQHFPFYIVQIAPWTYSGSKNTESAELREAQSILSNTIDHSGLVVTLDLGDTSSIHSGKKKQVGERLALLALAKDYDKKIVYSGPVVSAAKIKGFKIELTFANANNGLQLNDNYHNGFEIAGADRKFRNAIVVVVDNKIIISNSDISNPLFVRYAYTNGSMAKLFNKEGLPASTFEVKGE
jgi:sialate O-acetylesterase